MNRIENEETQLSVRSVRCQEKEESQKKSQKKELKRLRLVTSSSLPYVDQAESNNEIE